MKPFTKLFSSILSSSIWNEPDNVRIVWITLLAMADKDGAVFASLGGLAHMARQDITETSQAVQILESPDPDSRSVENNGRRIQKINGGWLILNYQKYRELGRAEDRREYFTLQKRVQRARTALSPPNVQDMSRTILDSPQCQPIAEAEAEAEVQKRESQTDVDINVDTKDASLSLSAKIQEVFDAWNSQADNATLQKCLLISTKRRLAIAARLKVQFFQDNWRDALKRMASSDFCKGISDRGWKASFDWFIAPDSVVKIMEGKYDNTTGKNAQGHNPRLDGVCRNTAVNSYDQAMFEQKMARQKAEAKNRPPIGP